MLSLGLHVTMLSANDAATIARILWEDTAAICNALDLRVHRLGLMELVVLSGIPCARQKKNETRTVSQH